ncbi:MAG: hypothetical protein GTO23_08730 [Nitrososphaeria archaeon]|nr:hypothetical protein [Nitrososphaeria archaeon]
MRDPVAYQLTSPSRDQVHAVGYGRVKDHSGVSGRRGSSRGGEDGRMCMRRSVDADKNRFASISIWGAVILLIRVRA